MYACCAPATQPNIYYHYEAEYTKALKYLKYLEQYPKESRHSITLVVVKMAAELLNNSNKISNYIWKVCSFQNSGC
jgi:hypothetical protein